MELRAKIDIVLEKLLAIIMGVMVINVLWQVFSRYILGDPSYFTDELARYLLIWLGLLGAAYVSGRNMHVAIDVFSTNSSDATKRKLAVTINLIIILFALMALVAGGIRLVYITYVLDQHSPALQIPLSVVYLIIPVSGMLIVYYKTADIFKSEPESESESE